MGSVRWWVSGWWRGGGEGARLEMQHNKWHKKEALVLVERCPHDAWINLLAASNRASVREPCRAIQKNKRYHVSAAHVGEEPQDNHRDEANRPSVSKPNHQDNKCKCNCSQKQAWPLSPVRLRPGSDDDAAAEGIGHL